MQELQHPIYLQRSMAEIDLAARSVKVRAIVHELHRQLLGGRGINARILYGLSHQSTNFLASESLLILGAGLLTGAPAPRAARVHLVGSCPRFGLLESTMLPGFFGAEMRFSGYDHLVIHGRSERPVYLLIRDAKVEFREASRFRGWDASKIVLSIREELDDEDVQVICLGGEGEDPGENTDTPLGFRAHSLFPAFTAMLEANNLRAVAARGTLPLEIYDPERSLACLKMVMDLACDQNVDGNDFLPDDVDEKATALFHRECLATVADALGIDSPLLASHKEMPQPYLELIRAVTGLEFSAKEILEVGERIIDLEKLLGLCEARTPAFRPDPLNAAFSGGPSPEVSRRYLEAHNRVRGLSSNGRPLPETLIRLGLNPESMDPL